MTSYEAIAAELEEMSSNDKRMRNEAVAGKRRWDHAIDRYNTARLKKLLIQLGGWPTISQLGRKAAFEAWVIAQHADEDPAFQESCLQMMKGLPTKEIDPTNIAYLEDRVRVNSGRLQLYGTQFRGHGEDFGPQPIEDELSLDERRAHMGLEPFEKYQQKMIELDKQNKSY